MPGDTKIKRSATGPGWVDVDNPGVVYSARWKARDARRLGTLQLSRTQTTPSQVTQRDTLVGTQVIQTIQPDQSAPTLDVSPTLTGLQNRLLNRMTNQQGVSVDDAIYVIESNGYNAAASYGHMREAGATHTEALSVIGLREPAVSNRYGVNRSMGLDHADAFIQALMDDDDDSDD